MFTAETIALYAVGFTAVAFTIAATAMGVEEKFLQMWLYICLAGANVCLSLLALR